MKVSRLFTLSMVALICALMLAAPARTAQADDLKIGICNPLSVATKIQEYRDIIDKAKSDKKNLDSVAAEKQEKLKSLKNDLDLLQADSPEYAEKNEELLKSSIDYEVWQKMTDLDSARKQKNAIRQLFDKIQAMTAQIAQQKGLVLVIADRHTDLPDNLDNIDLNQLEQIIMQRSVLYNDTKLDITGDVIAAMDKDYTAKH